MRPTIILYSAALASLASLAHSFRILPQNFFASAKNLLHTDRFPEIIERDNKPSRLQHPVMPENPPKVSLHSPSSDGLSGDSQGDSNRGDQGLIVSDILNKERDINGFASLARQIKSVFTRLNDGSKNTTVLAPSNAALQRLPRKPWESPDDYNVFGHEDAYAGQQGRERAAENLKRFVEMHVVPDSPWPEGTDAQTVGGAKTHWKTEDDGKVYIYPGKIEVVRVATRVSNGEVWIIDGVINY